MNPNERSCGFQVEIRAYPLGGGSDIRQHFLNDPPLYIWVGMNEISFRTHHAKPRKVLPALCAHGRVHALLTHAGMHPRHVELRKGSTTLDSLSLVPRVSVTMLRSVQAVLPSQSMRARVFITTLRTPGELTARGSSILHNVRAVWPPRRRAIQQPNSQEHGSYGCQRE